MRLPDPWGAECVDLPYYLSYLEGEARNAYMEDVQVLNAYAELNRQIIAREIMKGMKWKEEEMFSVAHNYLDAAGILHKGSISARKGERVLIPVNMKEGILLGLPQMPAASVYYKIQGVILLPVQLNKMIAASQSPQTSSGFFLIYVPETVEQDSEMKTVKGVYGEAKIFTDDVEDYAETQVKMICDHVAAEGSSICMMPDIHPGKVSF